MIIIFDDDYYLLTKPQAAPWSAAKSCQAGCKDFNDGRTIELNMMMTIFETTDGNDDSKILPSKLDRLQ